MPIQIKKLDSIRNLISNWADKKSLIYLIIVILVFFLALALIWYFSRAPEIKIEPIVPALSEEEIMKKQLEELEKLRNETSSLSEEEIQSQLKELEKLRQKTKPLSQEEIQKQLEELEKLRQ